MCDLRRTSRDLIEKQLNDEEVFAYRLCLDVKQSVLNDILMFNTGYGLSLGKCVSVAVIERHSTGSRAKMNCVVKCLWQINMNGSGQDVRKARDLLSADLAV